MNRRHSMNALVASAALLSFALLLAACAKHETAAAPNSKPAVAAASAPAGAQTLEVGCAGCVFHMPGAEGCQLAAKVDGKTYLVTGVEMPGHESGLCDRSREADVAGKIEGDTFVASSFTLKP